MRPDTECLQSSPPSSAPAPEVPPQDGNLRPLVPSARLDAAPQRSGYLHRPLDTIRRPAVAGDAVTELEQYKLSMRRYSPVQKGRAGLPWSGQWLCQTCGETAPGELTYDAGDDSIYLRIDCRTSFNSLGFRKEPVNSHFSLEFK